LARQKTASLAVLLFVPALRVPGPALTVAFRSPRKSAMGAGSKTEGDTTMTTNTTRLTDVHQQVTDQIVAAIEKGAGDYMMPWHCKGVAQNRPANILTGNRYRGVNVLALWVAALQHGFSSGTWGTYRQWQ